MDKRSLRYIWRSIRPIKVWHPLAICLISAIIAAVALRQNYQQMVELRNAVYTADKRGAGVEESLQDLRAFVGTHMNADLAGSTNVYPPVQLIHTYERKVAAEKNRVEAINSQVYTDAQNNCERLYPQSFSGGPRTPCIAEYVKSHGASVQPINDSVYKFDFASPGWSPDLAGWALALSGLFLALAALRLLLGWILKRVVG